MKVLKLKKYMIIAILFLPLSLVAEQRNKNNSNGMVMPKGLEGRVEFWKLVFSKYGKDHRVFHNRSHPEIIYSVLDFSEYEEKLTGKDLLRAKEQEILREEDAIRQVLNHFANGGKPRSATEDRVYKLFRQLPRFSSRMYSEALEDDQIRYQTGIRERFREGLVRSGKYLKAIEHVFAEEGLPPELGRLPLVESSFDYKAYSSVGAAGIWQFMPGTAKNFMRVSANLDERRDPIIATRAAAKYLKNSYKNTEHWPLAVTSYNHGLSGILRAAREVGSNNLVDIINRYESKSFGFASSNFYAEFLAALEVERNAEKYFPGIVRDEDVKFEEIILPKSMNFSTICQYAQSTEEEIEELNLGFLSKVKEGRVSVPAGTLVKIPLGRYRVFAKRVPSTQLVSVSTDFKSYLYEENNYGSNQVAANLPNAEVKHVDDSLEIVSDSSQDSEVVVLGEEVSSSTLNNKEVSTYKRDATIVTKEKGKLRKVNKSSKTNNSKTLNSKSSKTNSYTVKKGESLSTIAKKFKVSVEEIKKENKISRNEVIKAGNKLKIPPQ